MHNVGAGYLSASLLACDLCSKGQDIQISGSSLVLRCVQHVFLNLSDLFTGFMCLTFTRYDGAFCHF